MLSEGYRHASKIDRRTLVRKDDICLGHRHDSMTRRKNVVNLHVIRTTPTR